MIDGYWLGTVPRQSVAAGDLFQDASLLTVLMVFFALALAG
jgi:hypothetical protein